MSEWGNRRFQLDDVPGMLRLSLCKYHILTDMRDAHRSCYHAQTVTHILEIRMSPSNPEVMVDSHGCPGYYFDRHPNSKRGLNRKCQLCIECTRGDTVKYWKAEHDPHNLSKCAKSCPKNSLLFCRRKGVDLNPHDAMHARRWWASVNNIMGYPWIMTKGLPWRHSLSSCSGRSSFVDHSRPLEKLAVPEWPVTRGYCMSLTTA